VRKDGRNSEFRVLVSLYLHTNPFAMLKEAVLGMKLILRGRMLFGRDRIRGRKELRAILDAVEPVKGERPS
jgi:hypothetical protein